MKHAVTQKDDSRDLKTESQNWAKGKLTNRSLVAFDLDKTVLEQGDPEEIKMFVWSICHTLIHLAEQGYNISAVTGNSLGQLSGRFTKALVGELCRFRKLELLKRFHLFCNGASLYIEFGGSRIRRLIEKQARRREEDGEYEYSEEDLRALAVECIFDENPRFEIKADFINGIYLRRTLLPESRVNEISSIVQGIADRWWTSFLRKLKKKKSPLRESFFINYPASEVKLNEKLILELEQNETPEVSIYRAFSGGDPKPPETEERTITVDGESHCTQISVKDVLSFRHAKSAICLGEDPREKLVEKIRRSLSDHGIDQVSVASGGRGTIDVADQDANKKDALQYLIRKLKIKGNQAKGEGEGINVIYFGDEVVLRGNDYNVTEIEGIQVYAVNEHRERVPIGSNIRIPRTHQVGPSATDFLLTRLRLVTNDLLGAYADVYKSEVGKGQPKPLYGHKTSIRIFREQIEKEIIQEKILEGSKLWKGGKMDITVLQAISTLLTILMRDGELPVDIARRVSGMIDDFGKDARKYAEHSSPVNSYIALGGSHWDN